jgi:hypothetical protein
MFEVIPIGNRWTWRMICAFDRTLVYTAETYDDDGQAADAAKDYRRRFWAVADAVDHRMARCF